MIAEEPAADVVEVRRGEWVYHDCVCSYDGTMSGYSCSCCSAFIEEAVYTKMFHNSFCPSCSADMRGDKGGRVRSSKD